MVSIFLLLSGFYRARSMLTYPSSCNSVQNKNQDGPSLHKVLAQSWELIELNDCMGLGNLKVASEL